MWHSASLDRDMFYDASLTGVSFKNRREFDRSYHVDYAFEFETDSFDALVKFCIDNLDKNYSFSLLFYHFFLIMGVRIPLLSRGDDPICTTLAAMALSTVGIKFDVPMRELDLVKLHKLALEYSKEGAK